MSYAALRRVSSGAWLKTRRTAMFCCALMFWSVLHWFGSGNGF